MSFRDCVRNLASKAFLCQAKLWGGQVDFISHAGAEVKVWAIPTDGTHRLDPQGGLTDINRITFEIPRQTGFPPTASGAPSSAFKVLCKVRIPHTTGDVYHVESADFGGSTEDNAPVIILPCKRFGYDVELNNA